MENRDKDVIDLGDARIETRGLGQVGPVDMQTFLRTYDGGIQPED